MRRIFNLLLPLTLALGLSVEAYAIEASSTPLPGAQIGIAYLNPQDNQIYDLNGDTYFHPASTQKIVTALSAMLYLGPEYRLETRLQVKNDGVLDNKLKVDQNGVLNTDVLIKFTGDPTLTTRTYAELLQTLVKQKVSKINGKVYLDVSRFGGPGRAKGWSWDDLPVCFTAPSAAIILNRNCTYAELKTNGVGSMAEPLISSRIPISITAEVVAVNNRDYGGDCELETQLFIDNKYHITGCVPAENKGKPWPLSLAVADPMRWGIDWTEQILDDLNISYNQVEIVHNPQEGFIDIAKISSAPLKELVTYMLHRSNNLYADSIAKNVAAEYYSLPATYQRATRAMRAILSQYADIDLGDAYLVDGSGLSPHNLITPKELLELLIFIKNHDQDLGLIECFPVSYESGTLHWRGSTVNPPLAHNVIAKTGSLQNVSNLAGFVRNAQGQLTPFVMFSNSITYSARTRDLVRYRRITSPHYAYERYVLENIYNGKILGRDF